MIARVNFTARRKILRRELELLVDQTQRPYVAAFSLAELPDLPPDAAVFLEAYQRARTQRFSVGTLAAAAQAHKFDLPREFDERVLFRVKVIEPTSSAAQLLAQADRLAPTFITPQGRRRSLLPVIPVDLGDEVWRIEFAAERPELWVNQRIPDIMERARSATFSALVYPAVLRLILTRFLVQEDVETGDDDDSWAGQWIRFAAIAAGSPPPAPSEDGENSVRADWIEDAVVRFARRIRARSRYSEAA